MKLKQIIQTVCDEIGLHRPKTVIGNQEDIVRQLLALAQFEAKLLAREFKIQKWAGFDKDEDESMFDDMLLIMGIKWRFFKAKGLTYAHDWDEYQRIKTDAMAQEASRRLQPRGS